MCYVRCRVVVAIARLGSSDGNCSCLYRGKGIARACDGITCYSITDCTTGSSGRECVAIAYGHLCWRGSSPCNLLTRSIDSESSRTTRHIVVLIAFRWAELYTIGMCACVRYGSSGVCVGNNECTSHRSGATFENEGCTKISTVGYRSNSGPCRNRRGGFLNGDCFGYACFVVVAITRLGSCDGNRSCLFSGKGIASKRSRIARDSEGNCITRSSSSRECVGIAYSHFCWRCSSPCNHLIRFIDSKRSRTTRHVVVLIALRWAEL